MCGANPNFMPFQEPKFYQTRAYLPEDIRIQVVELLNQTLATSIDLKSQIRQATWNMRGINFYQFYLLFNEMSEQMEEQIAIISERISALASTPLVSIRIAAQYSQLLEFPLNAATPKETLKALIQRVSLHGKYLRVNIEQVTELEDVVTA